MMPFKHDVHLSAFRILPATVKSIEQVGFARDEFANNTRCLASAYHGTYRGKAKLPDNALWEQVCQILTADPSFRGCLEEESIDPEYDREISGSGAVDPGPLPAFEIMEVPAGQHKACDLHVGVNLTLSAPTAVEHLSRLQVASFDKPIPEGIRRVFTITCETIADGKSLFDVLYRHLSRVPGLRGKMKLETTTRFLRLPDDAPALPITTKKMVGDWLAASK